jgi:hypothetical protein
VAWTGKFDFLPFSAYGKNIQLDCAVLINEFCIVVVMATGQMGDNYLPIVNAI